MKALGTEWKALPAGDKTQWEEKAKTDKKRYDAEMKVYAQSAESAPKAKAPKSAKEKAATPMKAKPTGVPAARIEITESDDEVDDLGLPMLPPDLAPLLNESLLVPRKTKKMRRPKYSVGQQIVWMPQALVAFNEAYAQELLQLKFDSGPASSLMTAEGTADGTANSAVVIGIDALGDDFPGWSLLHLQSTSTLAGKLAENLAVLSSRKAPSVYSLPVVDPLHCSVRLHTGVWYEVHVCNLRYTFLHMTPLQVDQHACDLQHYDDSLDRLASSSHVSVFFATPPSGKAQPATEEVWEGRVYMTEAYDQAFPDSSYKSARVVWYQELKDSSNCAYVISDEQTDNEVSPWEMVRDQYSPCSHIATLTYALNRVAVPQLIPHTLDHEVPGACRDQEPAGVTKAGMCHPIILQPSAEDVTRFALSLECLA